MRQTSASNTGKSPGFANRAERHISTVREGIYGKLCLMDAKARLGRIEPEEGAATAEYAVVLVALTLSMQDIDCALLDADIPHGGLGILLGIEHEPGLSLQDIDAPLGRILNCLIGKASTCSPAHHGAGNCLNGGRCRRPYRPYAKPTVWYWPMLATERFGNTCRNCSWHSMLSPWSCRCLAWPVPRHTLHDSNDCARSFRETTSTTPHRLWCLPNHVGRQNDRHHQPSPPRRPYPTLAVTRSALYSMFPDYAQTSWKVLALNRPLDATAPPSRP